MRAQVLPELQACPSGQPILQADAVKFVTLFRSELPKASLLGIFPNLIALLKSESNVVHSYAAILIERLLASKVGTAIRWSVEDFVQIAVSVCIMQSCAGGIL